MNFNLTSRPSTDVPVLFTTFNRLAFTKKALEELLKSDCGHIFIVDNASTDGTKNYLMSIFEKIKPGRVSIYIKKENSGIAGAMNYFLSELKRLDIKSPFAAKVDNDTIVPRSFFRIMRQKMVSSQLDILQAKHPILKETHEAGFDEWMKTMKRDLADTSIYHSPFVGGSGVMFRTSVMKEIPETEWKLYGWRQFQKENPQLKKAFTTAVEIHLLDMHRYGGANYPEAYKNYYLQTGRNIHAN